MPRDAVCSNPPECPDIQAEIQVMRNSAQFGNCENDEYKQNFEKGNVIKFDGPVIVADKTYII